MSRRSAGFTLSELLLAIGMVAMLMLSLYTGMATAFRAKAVVVNQTDTLRQAKIALDLVEQDLRSILPPSGTLAGPFIGVGGGTGDAAAATIDCYSLGSDFLIAPGATDGDGIRHVQLAMAYDTATPSLARTITRNPMNASAVPEVETLARNVAGFGARYYDGTQWLDSWDSTAMNNALPLAVEITVSIKQPTRDDADHVYKLARIVPFGCGMTPDQAAALVAAQPTEDPVPTPTP